MGVNLPGTGDTVIKQAVPPGGDSALHLAKLKLAISPNVGNSGAQFLVVGDCVRASPFTIYIKQNSLSTFHFMSVCYGIIEFENARISRDGGRVGPSNLLGVLGKYFN